ncbi:MAG: phage tail assembly chaperone [Paracoccaceae bacterium]|nr:MAG: phage tail assembly chaperone [Paracoccaceae bacterium]
MRAGLHGLGLAPEVFWRLTPVELRIMLGAEATVAPLTRARLAELAAAFPDRGKDGCDGGAGRLRGADCGAGGDDGIGGRDCGGL